MTDEIIHDCQSHLAECALREDFTKPPPGIDVQLHDLALYLQVDLVKLYSGEIDEHALTRWFLWLLEVELVTDEASAHVAALYRRRLAGDEPTAEEWAVIVGSPVAAAQAARWIGWTIGMGWPGIAAGAAQTAAALRTNMTKDAEPPEKWASIATAARRDSVERMRSALFTCARGG